MQDCFEAVHDRAIQLKIAIAGWVRAVLRVQRKTMANRLFRAHALENPPGLVQRCSDGQDVLDLVSPRERAPIKEKYAFTTTSKKISCGLKDQLQYEIILASGVLDFVRGEDRMPKFDFAEHATSRSPRQFARKRGLASAGESGHENHHKKRM